MYKKIILLIFIVFFSQISLAKNYKYTVSGRDVDNNSVFGSIVSKNGEIIGYIKRGRDTLKIRGKWTGKGEILAEDAAGGEYVLEIK